MNFKNWILTEMPITNFQLVGDWNGKRQYGYNKKDIGILTNPKAVEKIERAWSNTKQNYRLFFVKSQQASKFLQVGEVKPEWIKTNLDIDIEPDPNAITIVFTNNTGVEKIPMTSWMIAHRFGHAISRVKGWDDKIVKELEYDFIEVLQTLYNQIMNKGDFSKTQKNKEDLLKILYTAIGTMKSAENNKLFRWYEFYFELLAQYLITGKLKFKPFPEQLAKAKRSAFGRSGRAAINAVDQTTLEYYISEYLPHFEHKYAQMFDQLLDSLKGRIFVM